MLPVRLPADNERSKILFYDHLEEVPKSFPPKFAVMSNHPIGMPVELYEELVSHQTKIIDDVVRVADCVQYTTWLNKKRYRVTGSNGLIFVVRRLDFD